MNSKHERRCSRSRRRFLGSAAAGALALAAGAEAGAGGARPAVRGDPAAEALLRRYGGEFGELRPGDR